ncbi:hypothetical protein SCHPADRAFT_998512 [Schizopora paradoxa]|uniref:Uncharacterized protein n=1 Tax=Schizopora paradoxa TaxID=27342 RepID=A0A0H2RK02_9AGAM|nr:hypothetical protein SCHPADRAFT_998512 [Schizopora paradoxa]
MKFTKSVAILSYTRSTMTSRKTITRKLIIQNLTVAVNCEKGFGSKPMTIVLNVSDDPEGANLTAQGARTPMSDAKRVSITNKKIRLLQRALELISDENEISAPGSTASDFKARFESEIKALLPVVKTGGGSVSDKQVLELNVSRAPPGKSIESGFALHSSPPGPLSRQWAVTGPDGFASSSEVQASSSKLQADADAGDFTSWAIIEDSEWIQAAKELGETLAGLN